MQSPTNNHLVKESRYLDIYLMFSPLSDNIISKACLFLEHLFSKYVYNRIKLPISIGTNFHKYLETVFSS